jgi:hypothetical protein
MPKSQRMGAAAPTAAIHDAFESRRVSLNELNDAINRRATRSDPRRRRRAWKVMDMVSRSDVCGPSRPGLRPPCT